MYYLIGAGILLILLIILILPGFFVIGSNEVGVLVRKMTGSKMPEGQIIARKNEIGVQAKTLMPGLYWRFPTFWSVRKEKVVLISPGQIGVIEAVDGKPLPPNRLLGDEISCDSFQDATAFLNNGGMKGPQVGFLRPGTYRINTRAFKIEIKAATKIDKDNIGVAIALDGVPLPSGYIVAPNKFADALSFFQSGQEFLNNGGYRGPQLETLQPGTYYINPLLFDVKVFPIAEVPPGYVAVIRSNVGSELEQSTAVPAPSKDNFNREHIHDDIEKLLITDKNTRGIWRDPVAPGKYNLNPIAFTAYMVPTSAVTIDWASPAGASDTMIIGVPKPTAGVDKTSEFFKFSQLKVTSKDGFQLDIDVRMVIRIHPANAAFVIARFGSVANLIEQIVHPLIDSSFRNNAGSKKAIEFVHSRTELQEDALQKAKGEFENYNVEAQNLLIAYINVDKSLLDTQTKREIAVQQQIQLAEEAKAQEANIAVQEKAARAAKQKDVIEAKLSIDINADKANARIAEAEGTKRVAVITAEGAKQANVITAEGTKLATMAEADGIAYKSQQEGEGIARAYTVQKTAIGERGVLLLRLFESIASGNVKIVPNVQVSADGTEGASLFQALIAQFLYDKNPEDEATEFKAAKKGKKSAL